MSDPGAVDPRIQRSRADIADATLRILLDEGWDHVTHAHVAEVAGYSRATVYKHWPTRVDLVTDAFGRLRDVPHHDLTGDVRGDLIAEVETFRAAMLEHRLDQALVVLVQLAPDNPALAEVRQRLVEDGERLVRSILAQRCEGSELEAATLMLVGAVLHAALLHGQAPSDEVIAASVDLVLAGLPERAPL